MIREIKEAFTKSSSTNLEVFLIENEDKFKEEYKMDGVLYYLNINELLQEEGIESKHFKEKRKEYEDLF